MITFQRIDGSRLYKPNSSASFVFLLWEMALSPPLLDIDETWADAGPPARKGYYVFLPSAGSAISHVIETALRSSAPEPETTGFAWFDPHGATTVVAVALDADEPVIQSDAPVVLPEPVMPFVFAAGLQVRATRDGDGAMDGLLLTLPRRPSVQGARGITIPFVNPNAGCIHFLGVLESTVLGDSSTKTLADVVIDPLRPTDDTRTHIDPLANQYHLSRTNDNAFTLLLAE